MKRFYRLDDDLNDFKNIDIKGPLLKKLKLQVGNTSSATESIREIKYDVKEIQRESFLLTKHYDPRIRVFAVEKLFELSNRSDWILDLKNYNQVIDLLQNSDRDVRILALKIVSKYAHHFTEVRIKNEKGFMVRLHDDAFTNICSTMNDMDSGVRAEAAILLGNFTFVSDPFLHQTLDKKIIPQMKVSKDGVVGVVQPIDIWSTGKKLSDDIPLTEQDEGDSLIPSGACGAFITALEDEFMIVRQGAVYSLGKLASSRPTFAIFCIDHLADMFNDEIQQVRLDAIRALTPIISHGILLREQLNTILTALDDATADNRMALHVLLAKANFADSSCVLHCLQILMRSLKRFSLDKYSIYKCISAIGLRHSGLIQSLVVDLLNIHPIFDMPEQNIEDNFYLAKLILVLNAASRHESICSLIPEYVKKHYRYLRRSSPHLIPIIERFEVLHDSEAENSITAGDDPIKELLRSTFQRVIRKIKPIRSNAEDPEELDPKESAKLAKVLDPSKESQNNDVIKFVAGIPSGITVRYILRNLSAEDLRRVRIKVEYPDQTTQYFRPRQNEFLHLNEKTIRLQTNVIVSAQRWAHPASVLLQCGLVGMKSTDQQKNSAILEKEGKVSDNNRKNDWRERKSSFYVLPDADNPNRENKISVNIHPMQKI